MNDGLFFAREYHAKFAQRRPLNEVDVAEDNVGPYLKTLVKRNNKRFACRTSGIGQKQNLAAVGHLGIQLTAFDETQEFFNVVGRIDEFLGEISLGVGKNIRDGPLLDDAARFHHGDAIADFLDHRHLVRDHHDRELELLIDFFEKLQNRMCGLGIECARSFVAQKHLRVIGKRSGNGYALLLTARELSRICV